MSFDELPQELERADALVCATSSPHALLGAEELAAVMEARDGRPLLILDLAVPRDVAPDVRDLAGVSLYDVDDLQAVVRRNRAVRQARRRTPRGSSRRRSSTSPSGSARWRSCRRWRRCASAADDRRAGRARERGPLGVGSERDRERVEAIAQAIVNRLLHEPTLRMKQLTDERVHLRMQVVRELFGLEESPPTRSSVRRRVHARAAAGGAADAPGSSARARDHLIAGSARAGARSRSRRPASSPSCSAARRPGSRSSP